MSSSSVKSPLLLTCPKCSTELAVERASSASIVLCANCRKQFLAGQPEQVWPPRRTSRKAIASLILALGAGITSIPALLLGASALRDMRRKREPVILSGKGLAIAGITLSILFLLSLFFVALPLLVLVPMLGDDEMIVYQHVRNERWQKAYSEHSSQELSNASDASDALWWLRGAPLQLLADRESYPGYCDEMLIQFGDTQSPVVAERVAKACLIGRSPTEATLREATRLANMAVTQDPDHTEILWFYAAQGLALYRNGDNGGAIDYCNQCRAGDPKDETWRRAIMVHAIEAMANSRLERRDAANRSLSYGQALLDAHPEWGRGSWHDRLIGQILVEEARETIAP